MSRSGQPLGGDEQFYNEALSTSPTLTGSIRQYSVPSSPAADNWLLHGRRRFLPIWKASQYDISEEPGSTTLPREMDPDELYLAITGYNQVFQRILLPVDNFFAMLATLGLATSMPAILFLISIYVGGPKAALVNWLIAGIFSFILTLCLGEIAASMPTSAGLYFYSYKLGGEANGPFLAWVTAWLSWIGWLTVIPAATQISTNFLLSTLKLRYPNATSVDNPWLGWLLILVTLAIFALAPNVIHPRAIQWTIRMCFVLSTVLLVMYVIWFPAAVSKLDGLNLDTVLIFDNWTNQGNMIYAADGYAWIVAALLPAWIFKGFEVSIHLSEETKQASRSVATSMWAGALSTYLIGILVLVLMLACVQDIRTLTNASRLLPHAFAEYLLQVIGYNATIFVLILAWISAALSTAVLFMSAQRLTFAMARDCILPHKTWVSHVSRRKLPVNAGIVVFVYSVLLSMASVSSTSAFQALLAVAVVSQNLSYAIVIFSRLTYGSKTFKPAGWSLGRLSVLLNTISLVYTGYVFLVLILPFRFPVEANTLNFSPIAVIIILFVALFTWATPQYGARKQWKGPRPLVAGHQLQGVRLVEVPPKRVLK